MERIKAGIKKLIQGLDIFNTTISYSASGEDIHARYIFNQQKTGYYIDIGAFQPKMLSNTYLLYRHGWRGINIEPQKENYKMFLKTRKEDKNINCAISKRNGKQNFYSYKENKGVQNAIASLKKQRAEQKAYDKKEKIKVYTLKTLLDKNLPKNQTIDFMDIDAEGMDIEILKSNDWEKYRPKVILIEETLAGKANKYLKTVGYKRIFILPCSSFYFEKNYYKESRFYKEGNKK